MHKPRTDMYQKEKQQEKKKKRKKVDQSQERN